MSSVEQPVDVDRRRTWFPELEALRGVAILLVFFYHADSMLDPQPHRGGLYPDPLRAWIEMGAVGVDLFFILSGFLLSLPFIEAARGGPPVSVGQYFARRALRIVPMYWVAVVVATVATAHAPAELLWGLPYLVFANAFGATLHPLLPHSVPWWSLATEVQFYLLLPVVGMLLCSRTGRTMLVVLLLAWALGYGALLGGLVTVPPTTKVSLMSSLVGRGPLFLLGMLAAWIHLRWGKHLRAWLASNPLMRAGGGDLLVGIFVLLGGLLLGWVVYLGLGRSLAGFRPLWHVGTGVCMTAILLLLLLAPLWSRSLLVNPVLSRIGVVSYSLFLIHIWPLDLALAGFRPARGHAPDGWTAPATLTVALVLVVCLALSELAHRWIERPFLARKGRVGR